MEVMGIGFSLFFLIYYFIMMAISVGTYVMSSLSLYTIAKRRGIKNPWLAWIPVGNIWIMGCISDQYQYVAKGLVKNKRKLLMGLCIAVFAVMLILIVILGVMMVQAFAMSDVSEEAVVATMLGSLMSMIVIYVILFGVAIAMSVVEYMAIYDLFASCDPDNKVIYLLLSIFVGFAYPILLFICRNKDLGMPPRKQEQPVYIPQPVADPPAAEK